MGTSEPRKTEERAARHGITTATNDKRTDEKITRARRVITARHTVNHRKINAQRNNRGSCPMSHRAALRNGPVQSVEEGLESNRMDGIFNTQRNLRKYLLNMQRNLHECLYCLFCFLSSDVFVSWKGRV